MTALLLFAHDTLRLDFLVENVANYLLYICHFERKFLCTTNLLKIQIKCWREIQIVVEITKGTLTFLKKTTFISKKGDIFIVELMCLNLDIDLGNDLGYLGLMNYANA